MARRKKPSFEDSSRECQENLIVRIFEVIDQGPCGAAAIGLDMAAQEDNWGLCLLTLDADYRQGVLQLLLPHRAKLEGFSRHCPIKPSLTNLQDLLAGLRERKITTAFAVDVPLGWPELHGDFTNDWSAMTGAKTELPSRDDFEYRMTDLLMKERLGANLFAVGADKIASAAFQWAKARTELGSLIDTCDVGFGVSGDPLVTLFETYPAAFVRLNYGEWIKYKTADNTNETDESQTATELLRKPLLDRLLQDYAIDTSRCEAHVQLSCTSPRSDAFDGLLSALTAWDYLQWRRHADKSCTTTTPEAILGRKPNVQEIKQIETEGWILTRTTPLPIRRATQDILPDNHVTRERAI
ncbi:MAG: DUF429 domain-containing protein [Pirellulaceae bacterium]